MMPARLRIVGDLEMPDHRYLSSGAQCYFWGEYSPDEYTQGKRWNYSPTNQLIANFKKSPERQGRPDWQYKRQAIQQVAEAFAGFWRWREIHQKYRLTLVPAPPSKPRDSALFDSRMGCMLQLLAQQAGVDLDIRDCLSFSGVHAASHACSQRPLPSDL